MDRRKGEDRKDKIAKWEEKWVAKAGKRGKERSEKEKGEERIENKKEVK